MADNVPDIGQEIPQTLGGEITTPSPTSSYTQAPAGPMDVWNFGTYLQEKLKGAQFSDKMLFEGAGIIQEMPVSIDQRMSMGLSEAEKYLTSLYGGQITPLIQALSMEDPEARSAALEYAFRQAPRDENGNLVDKPQGVWRGYAPADVKAQVADPANAGITAEDVSAFGGTSKLSYRLAATAAFLASADTIRGADGKIVTSYDYDSVLTPWERLQVTGSIAWNQTDHGVKENTIERASQLMTPGDKSEAQTFGFVYTEHASNTYHIDETWAKLHPVRALAVTKLISEGHPGAQVVVGDTTIFNQVTQALGKPMDWVLGAPAIAAKYATRFAGELGEGVTFDSSDREQFNKSADMIKADIEKGLFSPEEMPDALKNYARFRDWGSSMDVLNEGDSIETDIANAFDPELSGTGIGVLSADGAGLLPGDAAYEPFVMGVSLIAGFSEADPIALASYIRKGSKLAESVTTGSVTAASRSRATLKGLESVTDTGKYLSEHTWVSLAASPNGAGKAAEETAHAALLSQARTAAAAKGWDVIEVTNEAGKKEVLILGAGAEEGLSWARTTGVERFRTAEGWVNTDRTITPVDWSVSGQPAAITDADSIVLHGTTAHPITWRVPDEATRIKIAPPQVSRNWMVQRAFLAAAKTPDELVMSEYAVNASKRIFQEIEKARAFARARGYDEIAGAIDVLSRWKKGGDPNVLQALARARTPEELHNVLAWSFMGGITDPTRVAQMMSRQADITTQLQEIDRIFSEYAQLGKEIEAYLDIRGLDGGLAKAGEIDEAFKNDPELLDMLVKRSALTKLFKRSKLAQQQVDLLAEREGLKSMMALDELTMPIRQVPDLHAVRQVERIVSQQDPSGFRGFWHALSDFPGKFTLDDMVQIVHGEAPTGRAARRSQKNLDMAGALAKKYLDEGMEPLDAVDAADLWFKEQNAKAKNLFVRFGHVTQHLTGGREIHMPLPSGAPEGQLADYISKTVDVIRDHLDLLGVERLESGRLIEKYLAIDNHEDWYRFIKDFYETAADQSPILDAAGKQALRQTHQELLAERGGSMLSKPDPNYPGITEAEPTFFRTETDPITGVTYRSGSPIFSSEYLGKMSLPSNESLMQHLSQLRRWQNAMARSSGRTKYLGQALQGLRDVYTGMTYVWKSTMLMSRMPFALLSRIQGEQGWRMAALDYSSYVSHPVDWFSSMFRNGLGKYAEFGDAHAPMLGVLMDNYNDIHSFGTGFGAKVFRRGKAVLSPVDGDRYWNALSSWYARRFKSPEVLQYLRTDTPEEFMAWLRDPNSGALGQGILTNIESSGMDPIEAISRAKQELAAGAGGRADLFGALKTGRVDASAGKLRKLRNGQTITLSTDEAVGRLRFGTTRAKARTAEENTALQRSFKDKGWEGAPAEALYDPVTGKFTIVEGHHRIPAAQGAGVKEVPVHVTFTDTATIEAEESLGNVKGVLPQTVNQPTPLFAEPEWLDVGSREFGTHLRHEYEAGRLVPPQHVSARASEYVFDDRNRMFSQFRDWAFRNFYTKPDVYFSRAPFFRQVAVREQDRLLALGFGKERAKVASEAYAAEFVSDWMYDLAARTSAQYFLRNTVPFFPAWEELATVWLKRLPMQAGGGGLAGWGVGSLMFARKADVLGDFFIQTGLVQKDAAGRWTFGVPGLDAIWEGLTGNDKASLRFDVASIFGMLPIPGTDSFMPGLGPGPTTLISGLLRAIPATKPLADTFLRYGDSPRLGPSWVDNLFMAAGVTPPWEVLSHDVMENQRTFAVEDGLRAAYADAPPYPERASFVSDEEYRRAQLKWSEDLVDKANALAGHSYILRAVASMLSPVSPVISDDYKDEMANIWKFIEGYQEGAGEDPGVTSDLINAFKAANPNAVWYTQGKTIDRSEGRSFADAELDPYSAAFNERLVHVLKPEEFVKWQIGMNAYWNAVSKQRSLTEGKTWQQILMSGFELKEGKLDAWGQFQAYMDDNPDFETLFNEYNDNRPGEGLSMTVAQTDAIDASRALQNLRGLFTVNGIRDGDYRRVVGKLSESLGSIARTTDDPTWQKVNEWWSTVGNPELDKLDALYNTAFDLPKPEQGPVFDEIRKLKNSWDQFDVSPAEYLWGSNSVQEKRMKRLEWATSPMEWLSTFERGTAGFNPDPAVDKVITRLDTLNTELEKRRIEGNLSYSSREYLFYKDYIDKSTREYASSLGVEDTYNLMVAAPFERVAASGLTRDNKTFETIAATMREAQAIAGKHEVSLSGSTDWARSVQAYVFDQIEKGRDIDPAFDQLMSQLEVAMASAGRDKAPGYEMYYKLWFNYFGPTPSIGGA